MNYLAFTDQAKAKTERPISEGTRRDIGLIDAALSDGRRGLAEAALSILAKIVESGGAGKSTALTDEQRHVLASIGIGGEEMSSAEFLTAGPVIAGLAHNAQLLAEAIPLAEVARHLGVTAGRLRQRIAEGSLVAVKRPHGRGWLIPAFQMIATGEVPHLGRVLKARTRNVSAGSIDRVFRLPHDELGGVTPREWLVSGGASLPIERIISSL